MDVAKRVANCDAKTNSTTEDTGDKQGAARKMVSAAVPTVVFSGLRGGEAARPARW